MNANTVLKFSRAMKTLGPATAKEIGNQVWNEGNLVRAAYASAAAKVLRRLAKNGLAVEIVGPDGWPSLWDFSDHPALRQQVQPKFDG